MAVIILRSVAVLSSLWTAVYGFPSNAGHGETRCKAFPGSASWPSQDTWAAFNGSIGGRLIRPAPPGGACHPGQPTYDPDECARITTGWTSYEFHTDDPVSIMWNQFANDTCLPDPGSPCSAAGYPAYVVNATSTEDVKAAVDFARRHEIRLSVKSTGHDYQGRSVAPGSLSVWVHHLRGPLALHASFRPRGCAAAIGHAAATAGAGSQLAAVYAELARVGRTVVGGNGKTVSLGGYLTGGGHSVLAPRHGLAADQVYEVEVVTPAGDVVVANECQNQDLFWAMRGGGGSTFGIMTSVTVATHPSPRMVSADLAIVTPRLDAPYYWDLVGYLLSQFPYLDSRGVSGYAYFLRNHSLPITGNNGTDADTTTTTAATTTVDVAGMLGAFVITGARSSEEEMRAIWAPILEHVGRAWPEAVAPAPARIAAHPTFLDWYEGHFDPGSGGDNLFVGSRLLDGRALSPPGGPAALGVAFRGFAGAAGDAGAFLVAGRGARDARPRGGGNAVCPAWRRTVVHATNGISFPPLNATARAEALADLNASIEPLRELAPDMGSYVNENNPAEPDWQHSFWGENYERLLRIKRAIDPDDVLWCHPCVGNERWEQVGYRLCRVEE